MNKCREWDFCPCLIAKSEITSPIYVRNPFSNQLINVLPFFELLNKYYNDDPIEYVKSIDKEIQLIVALLPEDEVTLLPIKNMLAEMFARRDMEFSIVVDDVVQTEVDAILNIKKRLTN